jgi:hypothetical protein
MTTQRDVEQLLRRIPLSTPEDESNAADLLQTAVNLRNAAFEGGGVSVPGTTTALSIPALIDQMKQENYADVAVTLIGVIGDAAAAFSFLVTAGVEAGAIAGTGALSSAGVVAGMVGEAAGPIAIAAVVLIATFRIPSDVDENLRKLFFLTDASGILTSWMFNRPELNPHARLTMRARTGGYFRSNVSDACSLAHQRVQSLWRQNYEGNASARRSARAAVADSWERYWRQMGAALERGLGPSPRGVGAAWVQGQIQEANRRTRRQARQASIDAFSLRQRRAQGGYWIRTSDGLDLFIPDR